MTFTVSNPSPSHTPDTAGHGLILDIRLRHALVSITFATIFVHSFVAFFGVDFWLDLRAYEANVFNVRYYEIQLQNASGLGEYLTLEPLWHYVVEGLLSLGFSTLDAFKVVSIFSCFLVCYFLLSQTNNYLILIFLINPIFVDLVVGQLRSALSLALLLVGFTSRREWPRVLAFLLASFVHTSGLLFGAIYYGYMLVMKPNFVSSIKYSKAFWIGVAIALSVFYELTRQIFLTVLDDRRAETLLDYQSGALFGIGWLSFVISHFVLDKKKVANFPFAFYVINVMFFLGSALTGSYASRYIAVAYPMLLLMWSYLRGVPQMLFAVHWFLFTLIYAFFWLP